jgi:hypothetical protein
MASVVSAVVSADEPRQGATALALGRDRSLLLLGEEVVVEELVREPELRAAEGGLLRHSATSNLLDGTATNLKYIPGPVGQKLPLAEEKIMASTETVMAPRPAPLCFALREVGRRWTQTGTISGRFRYLSRDGGADGDEAEAATQGVQRRQGIDAGGVGKGG